MKGKQKEKNDSGAMTQFYIHHGNFSETLNTGLRVHIAGNGNITNHIVLSYSGDNNYKSVR